MDEYQGNLRMVTTLDEYSYSLYTDPSFGWTNYKEGYSKTCNSLFILDEDLKVIGEIEDIAPDERIYSARFSGEVGYFVTFRQVDPLFAVDLKDPKNPNPRLNKIY